MGCLHDSLKLQLAASWLCPEEVISLHGTSSAWLCIVTLLPGVRFAVSRCQRSGGDLKRSAAWWNELWLNCKRAVRQQGWPMSVWRYSCRCSRHGRPHIATESFFCAVDLILASAEHQDTCLAALAMDIEIYPAAPNFWLQCLVVLSSGRVAFVGTLETPVRPDERFVEIFHNVVVADSVEEAASAAVAFILENRSFGHQGVLEYMPWENDNGSLRVNFCNLGCRGGTLITIPDPFVIEDATMFMALASLLPR